MKWVFALAAILAGFAFINAQGCGNPSVITPKVIAGQTAQRGAWPWQALMFFQGQPGCGGSLVAPDWVITAAHCVYGKEWYPTMFTIRLGEHDWYTREGSEVDIQVSRVVRHPGYNPRTFVNDIAMLKLSRPVQYTQYIRPVCLPTGNPQVGSNCVLTGWGKIRHPGQMYHLLQQVNLPVVSNYVCNALNWRSIGIQVQPSMICGGDGGQTRRGGCHGDSGGPFVCNIGGSWQLHGAVSHGSNDCNSRKSYTVFSRVNYLMSFVRQTLGGYSN